MDYSTTLCLLKFKLDNHDSFQELTTAYTVEKKLIDVTLNPSNKVIVSYL